jgi:hypothetical protein
MINQIRRDNAGEYISNALEDCFLTSRVIYDLTPLYSPDSNSIKEHLNQQIKRRV